MIGSLVMASRPPQADRDQAAVIGQAEGRAALALLRRLGDRDWRRPTDCTEWDVVLVETFGLLWPRAVRARRRRPRALRRIKVSSGTPVMPARVIL